MTPKREKHVLEYSTLQGVGLFVWGFTKVEAAPLGSGWCSRGTFIGRHGARNSWAIAHFQGLADIRDMRNWYGIQILGLKMLI